MANTNSSLNLDKKTTISVGLLVVLIPLIFWLANVATRVYALEEVMNRQRDVIMRIDERTRQIQLDVQDLKSQR